MSNEDLLTVGCSFSCNKDIFCEMKFPKFPSKTVMRQTRLALFIRYNPKGEIFFLNKSVFIISAKKDILFYFLTLSDFAERNGYRFIPKNIFRHQAS